jgi:hypothetical protein
MRSGDGVPAALPATQTALVLALVMFAVYVLLARLQPELRYTRYALPAALAILWLARRVHGAAAAATIEPLRSYAVVVGGVCLWSACAIALTSPFYGRFFEEVLFLIAPLSAAMICASFRRDDSEMPLYALAGILAADYIWEISSGPLLDAMSNPGAFLADLLRSSTAATESVRAFSFGVLGVYFLVRRRFTAATLCVMLAILGGKRIALLGLAVAVPVALVAPGLERPRRRAVVTAVAIAINVAAALSLRNLDEWGIAARIQEVTMQSADAVMMGRVRLFGLVADRVPEIWGVGAGLGRITHLLQLEGAWLTNAHSDVLKHYVELGPVMFAGWIGSFYWFSRGKGALAPALFLNVLFLSDNVSIYFDVMFCFYLTAVYLAMRPSTSGAAAAARPRCWRTMPGRLEGAIA